MMASAMALAVCCAPGTAPAQNAPIAFAPYKHDRWPLEAGAPSRINAIAQTGDGFLWIGSVEGLFRFDGLSFEKFGPAPGMSARPVVSHLHVSRSGELWVGLARSAGVAVLHGGQLVDAAMPHPSREVNDIAEDAQGGIWIARGGRSTSTLARFAAGRWREYGAADGLPAGAVWQILFTRDGTQWVVLNDQLAWRPAGQARFASTGIAVSPRAALAQDAQGRLWLAQGSGIRQVVWNPHGAGLSRALPVPGRHNAGGARLLIDREGNLWETTWNGGVLRLSPHGGAAAYTTAQGLTSDQTHALAQDREGNVWIGTELGLDRLRPARIVVEPGIPANSPTSYRMAPARDGTVYVADARALYAIRPHQPPRRLRPLPSPAEALCADQARGLWVVTATRVIHEAADRTSFAKPAPGVALGCAQDREGRLWLPMLDHGLFWRAQGRWQAWPGAERGLPANVVLDGAGRAVVLLRERLSGGAPSPFLAVSSQQGRVGPVEGLMVSGGAVLISGAEGLQAPFAPGTGLLAAARYPWAASLNALIDGADGTSWGIGDTGIVRLPTHDLAQALRRPGHALVPDVFDFRDGLNSFVQKAPGAQVAQGGDGRVWFLTRRNVLSIDPARLHASRIVPRPVLRAIRVGGREMAPLPGMVLDAGTMALDILFTAPSMTMPDRLRFRYRLVGQSDQWLDPGRRRFALLRDLGPGAYRFELLVANEDGVWARSPLAFSFSIRPALHQRWWFWAVGGAAVLALLYGLYLARIRYVTEQIHERISERTRERERIARELHDTLIQSVQGLILIFHSAAQRLSHHPEAADLLLPAVDRAESVLVEGRDQLQGLRRMDDLHLHDELLRMLDTDPIVARHPVALTGKGHRRIVTPAVIPDLVAIAAEALRNAVLHAQAGAIELAVEYRRRELVLRISDDGIGIGPEVLGAGGRAGHYGLLGMRERAGRIGARLSLQVMAGKAAGTMITLRLPARLAYSARSGRWLPSPLEQARAGAARRVGRIRRCLPGW